MNKRKRIWLQGFFYSTFPCNVYYLSFMRGYAFRTTYNYGKPQHLSYAIVFLWKTLTQKKNKFMVRNVHAFTYSYKYTILSSIQICLLKKVYTPEMIYSPASQACKFTQGPPPEVHYTFPQNTRAWQRTHQHKTNPGNVLTPYIENR
jgi:hypothetical protein